MTNEREKKKRLKKGRQQKIGRTVGFLEDVRRLNVAITRAKYSLWIVGHARVLSQSETWAQLIFEAKRRNCFETVQPFLFLSIVMEKRSKG